MIPVRLRLRNFMSYGDEPQQLEFERFHVACLSGENGNGKSALLDAITYALWGRARISERRDSSEDELIHLGQIEMEVEFEFELDGQRYIVIRRRTIRETARRRTSSGVLELQVKDGDTYRALTGDSIHATQRKINEILRLDYETFVNSVFILQGRADEFTRKTATERKRILADLLNLGLYDDLEAKARETSREWSQTASTLERDRNEIDRQLAHEPEYRAELARLDAELDEIVAEIAGAQADVDRHRSRVQALESKEAERRDLEVNLRRAEGELSHLRADRDRQARQVSDYEAVVAHAAEIRRGHAEHREAQNELDALQAKSDQVDQIREKKTALSATISEARASIDTALSLARSDIARLSSEMAAEPGVREELADLDVKLRALEELEVERRERTERRDVLANELSALAGRNKTIIDEGRAIKTRIVLLDEAGALCPVCSTPLDAAGRDRARATLQAEREGKYAELRENQSKVATAESEVATLVNRLDEVEKALRVKSGVERAHARAEQASEQLGRAAVGLQAARLREQEAQSRLDATDYAHLERAEVARLDAAEAALGYDRARHAAVRERERVLRPYERRLDELEAAERNLPEASARLATLGPRLEGAEAAIARDRTRAVALDRELAEKDAAQQALDAARQLRVAAELRRAGGEQARGQTLQQISTCEHERARRVQVCAALEKAILERGYYDDLALAFGKKGIQAMIIEGAIPEIEREANDVLARMTDGRLNVKFETQRSSRAGDNTIETLDIKIADELGVRSLELYSGGEAFRVNFAIRIALSKLLAKRAGARIETLVIDEGFGSQDAFGRSRLVEAIAAISDDFKKIIVITHIDELKDAFPSRIDVVKTSQGSRITVS